MDNPEDKVKDTQLGPLPISSDEKERFDDNTNSMAETVRRLVRAYNEAEDRYEAGDDLEYINVVLLKTLKNALRQNVILMENQIDTIDEELEKFEIGNEEDEVVVTIDLDIAKKNL